MLILKLPIYLFVVESNMEGLKKRRNSVKSAITRVESCFERNKLSESDRFQFQQRLEGLKDNFKSYNEIQQQMEELEPNQESDRGAVEDKYYNISAKLCKKISEHTPQNEAVHHRHLLK